MSGQTPQILSQKSLKYSYGKNLYKKFLYIYNYNCSCKFINYRKNKSYILET